ncbi:MAG: DUF4012 domain-containing protein, partial [Nocardioidaceae bacterium]
ALVLLGVVAVVLVAYTGHQAIAAKSNLELVAHDFSTLSGQLTSGDEPGARTTLTRAQSHAREARANTHGPGWWLTSKIPGVGPNIVAVRTVADVTDDLSQQVLPDVVKATAALKPSKLRPSGGRIDLAPITAVAPAVVRANILLTRQSARVQAIDVGDLAPQIARPVRLLQQKLEEASALSDRASRAVRLLPPMLGADGTRTYLLLFQNNAEVRSTGGIPGSFATVVAEDGKVSVGRQGDAATIGKFATPPIALTRDERTLFGENLGLFPQDVNFTPDFSRSARIVQAMWNARNGVKVDGVISTDPVALSLLLRGTGPVTVPGGRQLTSANAVQLLLSQVYADIPDPARQNVYFDAVANRVFSAVASGQGRPKTVLDNLVASTDQRRILLWSDRPAEQALLAPTRLGGVLPTRATSAPDVGVYLDDGGGSKLGYYLDHDVDVRSQRCQADRQYLRVTLHLHSRVPADSSGLPDYVAQNAVGLPRGLIRTTIYTYAPLGGYIDSVALDGHAQEPGRLTHDGRLLTSQTVDLEPGGQHTLTFGMVSGKGQTATTDLAVTPGVRGDGVGTVSAPAC